MTGVIEHCVDMAGSKVLTRYLEHCDENCTELCDYRVPWSTVLTRTWCILTTSGMEHCDERDTGAIEVRGHGSL